MKQILLPLILALMCIIPCAAQGSLQKSSSVPKAEKVVEVEYFCNTGLDMGIGKFVSALRNRPGAQVYVIVYANPKIAESADALIRNTKWKFQERKIAENRIFIIEGGFREITTAEFFIVPKGAAAPVATPGTEEKNISSKL